MNIYDSTTEVAFLHPIDGRHSAGAHIGAYGRVNENSDSPNVSFSGQENWKFKETERSLLNVFLFKLNLFDMKKSCNTENPTSVTPHDDWKCINSAI